MPWTLYSGDALVQSEGVSVGGTARVWFTIQEKPTVRFDFTSGSRDMLPRFVDLDAAVELVVPDGVSVELVAGDEGERSSGESRNEGTHGFNAQGSAGYLTGGTGSSLSLLRFHLVNFGEEQEPVPRVFEVEDWTIRIAPTGMSPRLNGFAVTHVLDLVRSDASPFGVEDASAVREWLFDALAFAAGRFVGFAVAQGYREGAAVYLEANCTKADAWKTRRSWWDQRCLGDAELAELCVRWAAAAADQRTQSLLRRAAGAYVTALSPEPLDSAVPIAGTGVELMVWELIHQRENLLTTDEFDRLSFASRLRLALRAAAVPTQLPEECSALKAYVAGDELDDGPFAFTLVRNRLVHPPKKKRGWPARDVTTEGWLLGVEYLALLVLAALGYQGRYRSQFGWTGWPGAEVMVPWSQAEVRSDDPRS